MSYAAKCNLDKILHFKKRYKELERKHSRLPSKARTKIIVEEMASEECVGEKEIRDRIKAITLDETLKDYFHFHPEINLSNSQPLRDLGVTRLMLIGRLKGIERQADAFVKVCKEDLNVREVNRLIKTMRSFESKPKKEPDPDSGIQDEMVMVCPHCGKAIVNTLDGWLEKLVKKQV